MPSVVSLISRFGFGRGRLMVTITEHPEGFLVAVRAQPGAPRNGIVGEVAGALKVAVTAPAQDGRANQAIVKTLRDALGAKRWQIELVSGATSRVKKVLVRAFTKTDLEGRIRPLLEK